jgi:hypothetical protein
VTAPAIGAAEARDMWETWRATQCLHCGGAHARACPRVRRMAWHPNGQLAEVDFWEDGHWKDGHVTWPEDLPADPDA